ncbi:MAG: hypothetical protein ABR591_14050, partial [Candidatus Velthaea sp.]
ADAERREFARAVISTDLGKEKARGTAVAVSAGDLPARGAAACSEAQAAAVLGGTLATRSETVLGQSSTSASFELIAYDCAGRVTYRKTFDRDAGGDWKVAVERAVSAAVGAYMHPPKGGKP